MSSTGPICPVTYRPSRPATRSTATEQMDDSSKRRPGLPIPVTAWAVARGITTTMEMPISLSPILGTNVLYRNEGGRFTDVTAAAIPDSDRSWSTGSAFVDHDLDGDLDLYVANYLDYQFETDPLDENGRLKKDRRHYAPTEYPGQRDFLYRNEGAGRFVDVTEEAGLFSLKGRELGAVFFDWDGDGDPDLFQANDATPNFLYRNEGDGSFSEIGLAAGAAYNEAGKPEGGMGTDIADTDGDGHLEIVVTNFQWESNTLYQGKGDGLLRDRSTASGLGVPSFDRLAFGVNFCDFDRDGDPDLYVANGHIDDNIADFDPQVSHGQRDQLFLNDGQGRFAEISEQAGPFFQRAMVGRGAATADYDNDGDSDLLVVNSNQPAVLLRNDTASANHWLALRLVGTRSNRDGLGSRVTVQTGDREQTLQTRSSFSYLSQSDPRLFFGLGAYDRADRIDIAWPSGIFQQLKDVEADQILDISEPTEPVADRTLHEDSIHKRTIQAGERSAPSAFELERFWREAPPRPDRRRPLCPARWRRPCIWRGSQCADRSSRQQSPRSRRPLPLGRGAAPVAALRGGRSALPKSRRPSIPPMPRLIPA